MDTHFAVSLLLSNWSFEPLVIGGLILSAILYGAGVRYCRKRGIGRYLTTGRMVAFGGGLVVVLLALESPIDYWSTTYFWVHMLQHELLIFFAAPLLLLGEPMMPMWRGVPLQTRRRALRWVMQHRWPRRLWHSVSTCLREPRVTWALFIGNFALWHVPWMYDLTLANDTIHICEHILFIVTALLFWSQVIPSLPFKPILIFPIQALYLLVAAVADNVIGLVFMYWTTPLYAHYAAVARTPGMLSPVADQQWAGGVMDTLGTLTFTIVIVLVLMYWLEADERAADREAPALQRSVQLRALGPVR